MPYTGPYSLGTRCLTEFFGTALVIFLGESILANELLPSTKGHAMGFGWVAISFGFAFTFAIQIFSYASAKLNPAMSIALWLRGDIDFVDFLAYSAAQMAGGFCGACLVYLMYLPHFRTLPEVAPSASTSPEDTLLRTRDVIEPSALRLASYSTDKPQVNSNATLAQRIQEAKYYLLNENFNDEPEKVVKLLAGGTFQLHGVEVPFPSQEEDTSNNDKEDDHHQQSSTTSVDANNPPRPSKLKRRHSLQVAEMQRMLRKLEHNLKTSSADPESPPTSPPLSPKRRNSNPNLTVPEPAGSLEESRSSASASSSSTSPNVVQESKHTTITISEPTPASTPKQLTPPSPPPTKKKFHLPHLPSSSSSSSSKDPSKSRSLALARASTLADQASKLSIFATRPAIYVPLHNLFVEFFATTILIGGVLLIEDRWPKQLVLAPSPQQSTPPEALVSKQLQSLSVNFTPVLIGFYIMVLILALGGPTGLACNPARDLAPRLAHWVLPIPGKGGSELRYGLMIAGGAMVGGIAGFGMWKGLGGLNAGFTV
ncbi:hypothetical protein HDV05_004576 [Chytridiales sp. JEL 0842]|nr:hypothetical protein HDV05_004576 [Chytridiales sp. JEL 0842]